MELSMIKVTAKPMRGMISFTIWFIICYNVLHACRRSETTISSSSYKNDLNDVSCTYTKI